MAQLDINISLEQRVAVVGGGGDGGGGGGGGGGVGLLSSVMLSNLSNIICYLYLNNFRSTFRYSLTEIINTA